MLSGLALVFVGGSPPLYEQVGVGDFSLPKHALPACCCYVLLTWSADDVRNLLALANFFQKEGFFRSEPTSGPWIFFLFGPERTCIHSADLAQSWSSGRVAQSLHSDLVAVAACVPCLHQVAPHSGSGRPHTLRDPLDAFEELWSGAPEGTPAPLEEVVHQEAFLLQQTGSQLAALVS